MALATLAVATTEDHHEIHQLHHLPRLQHGQHEISVDPFHHDERLSTAEQRLDQGQILVDPEQHATDHHDENGQHHEHQHHERVLLNPIRHGEHEAQSRLQY